MSNPRSPLSGARHRPTQRKMPSGRDDEEALTAAIIRLASQYGRYGYRRITALLRAEGRHVNVKRVQRIWRREGLKVPKKQPKRGRLWLNDGSCIRRRPCWPNHVRSYDFVMDRTQDGRKFRMRWRRITTPSGRTTHTDTDRRPRKPSCRTLKGRPTLSMGYGRPFNSNRVQLSHKQWTT